jgi:uncharacterized protein
VIVVSDSSPLIALAAIGQLQLVRELFGEVLVPEAVWEEISHQKDKPGAQAVLGASWVTRVEVAQDSYLMALQTELDDGEAEALALAAEVNADMVLLDERRGRKVAVQMGFKVIGAAGVLGLAKAQGLLPGIRPLLDAMSQLVGFRIGRQLYEDVLRSAGEL